MTDKPIICSVQDKVVPGGEAFNCTALYLFSYFRSFD